MISTRRRRHTSRRSLLFLFAGLLLGCVLTLGLIQCSAIPLPNRLSAAQLMDQGYVPLDKLLRKDGYAAQKHSSEYAAVYSKDTPSIVLTLNAELSKIKKNSYTHSAAGQVVQIGKRYYIQKDLLEQVLGCTITRDKHGRFSLSAPVHTAYSWIDETAPLIAHAGGSLVTYYSGTDGWTQYDYTDSREAWMQSYSSGWRVMELDFSLSSDGVLCATHDWNGFDRVPTADEWRDTKIDGMFTPLTLEDVLYEMTVAPNVVLILDLKCKNWSQEKLAKQYTNIVQLAQQYGGDELTQRIVPQIYHPEEYDLIHEIYDWPSVIFTLYSLYQEGAVDPDEIARFVQDKPDIAVVTMPKEQVTDPFSEQLHSLGKYVFTHTVNSTENLYQWKNLGVDGFYTNTITPAMYRSRCGIK
ncbi:MAG: glycerophosphodiester phosphodiesterase family protein [Butyricicoccus sp.]